MFTDLHSSGKYQETGQSNQGTVKFFSVLSYNLSYPTHSSRELRQLVQAASITDKLNLQKKKTTTNTARHISIIRNTNLSYKVNFKAPIQDFPISLSECEL